MSFAHVFRKNLCDFQKYSFFVIDLGFQPKQMIRKVVLGRENSIVFYSSIWLMHIP